MPPGAARRCCCSRRQDLASGTSSNSSKLIHGGLRYLEHYEFGLVREALGERERLWAIAPHIIWPMRFVLPWVQGLRPRWLLRLGLFLYDHIGARKLLPATETIRLDRHPAGAPLKPEFVHGFVYSDGWVDDARLVVLNARDAADHGAEVRTRCPVTAARARQGDLWRIETRARRVHRALGDQRRWPIGAGHPGPQRRGAQAGDPAGARLAYRGAQAVRPPAPLFLPAARWPHLLRDPL